MANGTVGVHVRLSRRHLRVLDRRVKKDGEDRSTYIRLALDDWLDRHESGWRDEPRQQDRAA